MVNNINKYLIFGNKSFLDEAGLVFLGIVGSRSILNYTNELLEDLFFSLKDFKVCIISGGMYGVDTVAHNLSFKYGIPTIVVLPCGIDAYRESSLFYNLKRGNSENYCLVSAYPSDYQSRKFTFLERNKLIVDWSDIVLVAQSGEKSGSIFSGNYALKTSKPLYSIPNSLERKQFQGNNLLISKGAKIYLSPKSLTENLPKKCKLTEPDLELFSKFLPAKLDVLCRNLPEYNPGLIEESLLKLILEGKIFYEQGTYFVKTQNL